MAHLKRFVSEIRHAEEVRSSRNDDFGRRRNSVAGLNADLRPGAAPTILHLNRAARRRCFATQVIDLHHDLSAKVERLDRLLTGRQIEIACGIAAGRTNHQISRELRIKESTVNEHIRNIKKRLGLEDRVHIGIVGHSWILRSWGL